MIRRAERNVLNAAHVEPHLSLNTEARGSYSILFYSIVKKWCY